MQPIKLIAGFLTVGVWTLLSRVLGFVRDILIAATLGTGPVAEAFFVAFALPNMFRRFFAEGAFNMAFVPMFSKKLESDEGAEQFARDAFAGLATVLIALTLLAQLVMPWLVLLMAGGFAEDQRLEIATGFGRIVFAYILFISLAALLSGVLNAMGRFAAAAAAPVVLNIILISVLLLARTGLFGGVSLGIEGGGEIAGLHTGTMLAWGATLAGIAQLALVWVAAHRSGMSMRIVRPRLTPDVRKLAVIAAPAALAGGVMQVNLLIGRQVASFFDGAIGWLNYADRLYQLPLGVVGIAIGVVLLPDLSRRLSAGDTEGGRDAFNRACEYSLALTIPAAVALVVVPTPLVSVLYQRGAFGADDTAATALAVAAYGLGLPAFVLQKTLQPLFFAREDTTSPFRYALVSMAVNAVVAVGLSLAIGFIAAALGTTLAAWAQVVLLWRGSRRMGDAAYTDARFRRRLWRMIVAALLMGAVLMLYVVAAGPVFGMAGARYLALLGLVALGMVSYFGFGQLVGAFRLAEFRRAMSRRG